jgi:copper chaperone CopZ
VAFGPSPFHLASIRAVLVAVVLLGPIAAHAQAPTPPQPPAKVTAKTLVHVAVGGMNCSTCASTIKAMLRRTAGVKSATVSYDRGEAIVEYDPKVTNPAAIVKVIENLGYSARVKA